MYMYMYMYMCMYIYINNIFHIYPVIRFFVHAQQTRLNAWGCWWLLPPFLAHLIFGGRRAFQVLLSLQPPRCCLLLNAVILFHPAWPFLYRNCDVDHSHTMPIHLYTILSVTQMATRNHKRISASSGGRRHCCRICGWEKTCSRKANLSWRLAIALPRKISCFLRSGYIMYHPHVWHTHTITPWCEYMQIYTFRNRQFVAWQIYLDHMVLECWSIRGQLQAASLQVAPVRHFRDASKSMESTSVHINIRQDFWMFISTIWWFPETGLPPNHEPLILPGFSMT